jgi:hypothetical protein
MHNATPGFAPPDDGASVLVVEGVGTGLGGCSSSDSLSATDNLNLINEITILNIEAHKPTVTEISPQAPTHRTGGRGCAGKSSSVLPNASRYHSRHLALQDSGGGNSS